MEEEYRRNGFLSEMTYSSVGREGGVRGGFSEVAILGLQYINLIFLFVCLFVFMARVGEENRDSSGVSNML